MSNVRVTKNTMSLILARMQKELDSLPDLAFDTWVSNTPVRSGNARRNTRLQGDTIQAKYNYAVPLDQGRSRQSPQGMSKPTERRIERELRRIIRK